MMTVDASPGDASAEQHSAAPTRGRPRFVDAVLPAVSWALGAAVFFRDQLTSGTNRIMGNDGDSRLIVFLHEHWYALARGDGVWRDPIFYHPADNVLGYSDTFVLNVLFYAPLRVVGFDPFLAFQLTLVVLSAVGFAALYVILRRHLHVRRLFASGGCLLFCFANNEFIKVGQPQLLSGWWTPLCALAGLTAIKHGSTAVRMGAAVAFGALASLIVYSSFYIGWTTIFASAVAVLTVTLVRPLRVARYTVALGRQRWREALLATAGSSLGLIPFLMTYLPVLEQAGGRKYEEIGLYAPRPGDLLNLSSFNYVWGSALRALFGSAAPRLQDGERTLATTPLLFVGAVIVLLTVLVLLRRRRGRPGAAPDPAITFAFAAVAVSAVLSVLPVWVEGRSLWYPIWAYVPGGSVIRAPGRVQILASQLAAVALAVLLSKMLDLVRSRRQAPSIVRRVLATLLLGSAIVEQLNLTPSSNIDRQEQLELTRGAPPPPPTCSAFFVTSTGEERLYFIMQIDAMLVAQRHRIPTVNGYSGLSPKGWMLNDVQTAGYLDNVKAWTTSTGSVGGLCSYDLETRRWAVAPIG